jgi:hypothetical protein
VWKPSFFKMTTPADLNLGPLTTQFSAAADCSSLTVSVAGSSFAPYAYPRLFSSIAKSCFPSGYPLGNAAVTSTFAPYAYQDQHVYYSPGICPSSWLMNTVGSTGAETTAFCCPPGFNPRTTPAVSGGASSTYCTSTVNSTVITTVAYTDDGAVAGDGFTQTFTFTSSIMPAGAVWIRYKDTDNLPFTTTGSSQSKSTSSKDSPTGTPNSPPSSAPSGLSSGAKIGLGVGVPLVVLLAALIFAFIFIRRRQRNHATTGARYDGDSEPEWNTTGLLGPVKKERPPSELHGGSLETGGGVLGRPQSELPADEVVVKLNSWVERSEMDSGQAGRHTNTTGFPLSELPG